MAVPTPDLEEDSQFRIEASGGYREPRTRILKHGESFAVLDPFGDMVGGDGMPDGLYHEDTRFLSRFQLRLNGDRPLLLSSQPAEEIPVLSFDLANPDSVGGDGAVLRRELIYLSRRQFVWKGAYYELLLVRNFDVLPHVVTIGLRFAADFADVFEVRGQRRPQRGQSSAERISDDTVALRYRGLDDIERVTTLRFEPAPAQLDTVSAAFVLQLKPGEWRRLRSAPRAPRREPVLGCAQLLPRARSPCGGSSARRATGARASTAPIRYSARLARAVGRRSLHDGDRHADGPYPYAGMPWFSTPFGRDGIITAL